MCRFLLFESIAGVGFPLLPMSVLFHFIVMILNDNLFAGDTRALASLGVSACYFLAILGIAGTLFYHLFTILKISFSPFVIRFGFVAIALFPIIQHFF